MTAADVEASSIVVFAAKRIITMDPERPSAEAVAVVDGRIVAVGSVDEVRRRSVTLVTLWTSGLRGRYLSPV